MDVSDAMENIKDLIWNEVSHSPASHLLQQTRPVELTLFTQRQKKIEPSQSLNNGPHYFHHKKYNPYQLEEFREIA